MPGSSPEKDAEVEVEKTEATEQVTDGNTSAESSPAEPKGDKKGDMLSAVKAALEPTEKAPDSDTQGSKPDEKPTADAKEGEEAGDESDDLTEEELARLRPKTRKRIDNLLKDRADRDKIIAETEPKAKQFDSIVRFVEDAGLTKDEVNKGFDVMSSLKNDPFRAHELLRPIMDQLEQIVGMRLPEDLQNAVQLGQITEAHARELASNRSKASVTQHQLQRRDERDRKTKQDQDFQASVDEVSGAVSAWERSKEKSDPDWKLKQPRITEIIELEVTRRRVQNPSFYPTKDEALKFASDALERVEKEFRMLAPRKREIKPGHVDGGSAPHLSAKPKSMLEAARAGLKVASG